MYIDQDGIPLIHREFLWMIDSIFQMIRLRAIWNKDSPWGLCETVLCLSVLPILIRSPLVYSALLPHLEKELLCKFELLLLAP